MAITDYKITDGEITQRNVKSAPDVLSDTPNNNKAVFDNLTEHFIGKYNDLIDNINSDFVDSSEFAEGLTVTDKVRWRYALTKGASIGLNFSGNITQITTGYRTIVGDIDGLTETDFMDCYLSINGTDYECGDSYASGNSILTSAEINGVTVEIIYDTTNGNITLEHATNPLDTLYWNVSMYRGVAEKVPAKCLPADLTSAGYAEVSNRLDNLDTSVADLDERADKWNYVELDKDFHATPTTVSLTKDILSGGAVTTVTFAEASYTYGEYLNKYAVPNTEVTITSDNGANEVTLTVGESETKTLKTGLTVTLFYDNNGDAVGVDFAATQDFLAFTFTITMDFVEEPTYMPYVSTRNDTEANYTALSTALNGMICVTKEAITLDRALSANSAHTGYISVTKDGYVALGVVGHDVTLNDGTATKDVVINRAYISPKGSANYRVCNVSSSSRTVNVHFFILWIREPKY